MAAAWTCPNCQRTFARKNQRHRCGTGDSSVVVRGRSPDLQRVYKSLEAFALSLGAVEVVARERYVLFRSTRIFADLTVMTDALRLAIHLPREAHHPLFIKVGADRRQVTHVGKLHDLAELRAMQPFLREAYEHSLAEAT